MNWREFHRATRATDATAAKFGVPPVMQIIDDLLQGKRAGDERQAAIERIVRLPEAWLQEFSPPPKPWWRRWLAKLRSLTEG